jgi:hypothetical protein
VKQRNSIQIPHTAEAKATLARLTENPTRFCSEDYNQHADLIAAIELAFRRGPRVGWRATMALLSEAFARGYQAGEDDTTNAVSWDVEAAQGRVQ